MKIETKFDINNLVKRKFDRNQKNVRQGMEVMEIITQTCWTRPPCSTSGSGRRSGTKQKKKRLGNARRAGA